MHRIAEEGIAAHWKYKEGKKGPAPDDQRIAWLRHLVEWQHDMQDPAEFMSTLKVDLYPEEVYTFTPRGKVIVLPRDATPIDFAYTIHSDVGQTCVGAKVNGRIVPLRYALRNGDIVEIMTQAGHLPSKDWLTLVKTAKARNKIKHVINTSERLKAIEIGEKYLEKEARRLGVQLGKISKGSLESVAGDYGYGKIEDLYAALGYGKYSARQVLQKLAPGQVLPESAEVSKAPAPQPETVPAPAGAPRGPDGDAVIRVKGMDDLLVYRAKCCNPIRGEAIVGYVTRGKGVAVHSKVCTNVQNLMYDVERKIEVEWARSASDRTDAEALFAGSFLATSFLAAPLLTTREEAGGRAGAVGSGAKVIRFSDGGAGTTGLSSTFAGADIAGNPAGSSCGSTSRIAGGNAANPGNSGRLA